MLDISILTKLINSNLTGWEWGFKNKSSVIQADRPHRSSTDENKIKLKCQI